MTDTGIVDATTAIRADEPLVRHVHPDQWNFDEDRPMSLAFANARMSVDREEMRSAKVACGLRPGWGFARVLVSDATGIGLEVRPDPKGLDQLQLDTTPTIEYNPAHALVLGRNKNHVRKLHSKAERIYRPGEC